MDVIMLSIPRLLFCVLDIYMFCRFFKAIFDGFSSMRRLSIGCVLIAILSFIINSFGLTGLNLVFIPILYFGFALYVFQIPVGCALVYTIIFYTIFAGGEAALEIIFRFLSQNQIFMIRTIRNFIRNVLHCVKMVSVTNKHFHTKKKMN